LPTEYERKAQAMGKIKTYLKISGDSGVNIQKLCLDITEQFGYTKKFTLNYLEDLRQVDRLFIDEGIAFYKPEKPKEETEEENKADPEEEAMEILNAKPVKQ